MTPHVIGRRLAAVVCSVAFLATLTAVAQPAGAVPRGAPPTCPAAAGNARLVRYVYLNILSRCPDSGGLAYWTGRLDGGLSRPAFTEAIDTSNENLVRNNAIPLYQDFLGRPPTAAETSSMVAYLRANHQDGPIIATILASDEFYDQIVPSSKATPDKVAHDAAWLDTAYRIIVERPVNSGGAAYWQRTFGADGSSAAERFKVTYSLEHTKSNAISWVTGIYFASLGRPPDPAGLDHWVRYLQGAGQWQTFRLYTRFLATSEAYRLAQTQPNPPPEMMESTQANRSHYRVAH